MIELMGSPTYYDVRHPITCTGAFANGEQEMSFGDLEAIGKSALRIYRRSEKAQKPIVNPLAVKRDLELIVQLTTKTLK